MFFVSAPVSYELLQISLDNKYFLISFICSKDTTGYLCTDQFFFSLMSNFILVVGQTEPELVFLGNLFLFNEDGLAACLYSSRS